MGGTLVELYTRLEEKLGKETAKVLVEAIEEITEEKKNTLKFELKEELLKEVATKADVNLLLEKMQTLEEKLGRKIEQIKSEMQALEEKLGSKIEQTKSEILKWLIVLFIGQATFIVGLVFTLIKLLK